MCRTNVAISCVCVCKGSFPHPRACLAPSPLAPLSISPCLGASSLRLAVRPFVRQVMETNENVDTIKGFPPAAAARARQRACPLASRFRSGQEESQSSLIQ